MSVKLKKFRRKFTKEFKEEAVNLVVQEGLTQAKVCSDLGINSAALGRWILQSKADGQSAFPGNGKMKPSERRVQELEAENRRLKMERDILKKAMAYFLDTPK